MAGVRKNIASEFTRAYVFHLRGNQRTSGETSRKEGGKVFGSGSRSPIAISLFVKSAEHEHARSCDIQFHDIGDYLSAEQKLKIVQDFGSINGLVERGQFRKVAPDKHHDWVRQRDNSFYEYIPVGSKKDSKDSVFQTHSRGLETNRDAWCFNYSSRVLAENVQSMISFYNREVERFAKADRPEDVSVDDFITIDTRKISWNRSLKQLLFKGQMLRFADGKMMRCLYRPFSTQWVYFSREVIAYVNQLPRIFPDSDTDNTLICINGVRATERILMSCNAART